MAGRCYSLKNNLFSATTGNSHNPFLLEGLSHLVLKGTPMKFHKKARAALAIIAILSLASHSLEAADISSTFAQSWDGEKYSTFAHFQKMLALTELENYPFQDAQAILDIGSGSGDITIKIASALKKGNVTGMDCAEKMIQHAQKSFPKTNYENLSFVHQAVEEMKYKEQFDQVFSFCCLHWVTYLNRGLSNIHTSLTDNGKVLFLIPLAKDNAVFESFLNLIATDRWKEFFKTYQPTWNQAAIDAARYAEEMAQAGFENIEYTTWQAPSSFATKEEVASWLGTLPFTENLPKELKATFLEEHTQTMIDQFAVITDQITFFHPFVKITATKKSSEPKTSEAITA